MGYRRVPTTMVLSCPSNLTEHEADKTASAILYDQRGYTMRNRRFSWRNAGYQSYVSFDGEQVFDPIHTMPLIGGVAGTAVITVVDSSSGIRAQHTVTVSEVAPSPGQTPTTMVLSLPSTVLTGSVINAVAQLNDQNGLSMAGRTFSWALSNANAELGTEIVNDRIHTQPILGRTAGSVTVTVTDPASGKSASGTLTVQAVAPPPPSVIPSTMTLSIASDINLGEVIQATAKLLDQNGLGIYNRTFQYASGTPANIGLGNETISDPTHYKQIQGLALGSSVITVTDVDSGLSATDTVTCVTPPSSGIPWRSQKFEKYTTIQQVLDDDYSVTNTDGWWSAQATAGVAGNQGGGEVVNASKMSLETNPYGIGGARMLRYRRPAIVSALCAEDTISTNIQLPTAVQGLWLDIYAVIGANFSTGSGGLCNPTRNPDYKFLFGRITVKTGATISNPRFELKLGTNGNALATAYPGQGTPTFYTGIGTGGYFDGLVHRWRLGIGVGPAGFIKAWLDNTLFRNTTAINLSNASNIYGVKLGANMNQVPIHASPFDVEWLQIDLHRTDPGW